MKKNIYITLTVIMLSFIFICPMSYAFGKGEWQKGEKKHNQMGFMKNLDLTEQQKASFLEERQKMEKEMLALKQKNQKTQLNMQTELKKETPDKKVLYNYINEINANKVLMQKKRLDYILKMRSQLTPEQRKKFKKLK